VAQYACDRREMAITADATNAVSMGVSAWHTKRALAGDHSASCAGRLAACWTTIAVAQSRILGGKRIVRSYLPYRREVHRAAFWVEPRPSPRSATLKPVTEDAECATTNRMARNLSLSRIITSRWEIIQVASVLAVRLLNQIWLGFEAATLGNLEPPSGVTVKESSKQCGGEPPAGHAQQPRGPDRGAAG
jgi:hypothetical protein